MTDGPQDTGDVAEVPEDQRSDTDDYEHPENVNDPVDLSDVEDDGEIVDVADPVSEEDLPQPSADDGTPS